MRVKISYTVELEEVEREISEIMSKATDALDFCYQETINLQNSLDTKTNNIAEDIELIKIMRNKMLKADQVMEDCCSVLEGLLILKQELKEKQNEIQDG